MDQERSEAHRAQVRALFHELLAWVVYDREKKCRFEHRWDIDGRVADAYIDAHGEKIDYLLGQTSYGISREPFANRFLDFVLQCYIDMTRDRSRWLPDSIYS